MILKKFKNKKVLVTGHSGFKGSWLSLWLHLLGAKVYGIGLKPKNESHFNYLNLSQKINSHYINILDKKKFEKKILSIKPDYIFHLAAQALVPTSIKIPELTWKTNLNGTINILETLIKLKKKTVCIFITSDKCYKNLEKISGYKENDELGGEDPYSGSKASAEIAINSYFKTYLKKTSHKIATARAGNVIGGGDWSEGRIIPDCMKSIFYQKKVKIRNLKSSRPWQHILDLVYGYMLLAIKLSENKKLNGNSFNFGPSISTINTIKQVLEEIKKSWSKLQFIQYKKKPIKETNILVLNSSKSKKLLKWKTCLSFKKSIKLTTNWYKEFYKIKKNSKKSEICFNLSSNQIKNYQLNYFND